MFGESKYVTYRRGGVKSGIVFDPIESHAGVASGMRIPKVDIIGAGFVQITSDPKHKHPIISTFGRSDSLDIGGSEFDRKILEKSLNIESNF